MQRTTCGLNCVLLCLLAWGGQAQQATNRLVFQADFEKADSLRGWQGAERGSIRLGAGFQGGQALEVESIGGASSNEMVRMTLPVEAIRGARVFCEGMIKADGVTAPPQPWNGIKMMLHVSTPGGQLWPQQNSIHGTFDWKKVSFKTSVPKDASAAELVLGLEAVHGKARFDQVRVSVIRPPTTVRVGGTSGPVYKGHSLPRLRGAMISTFATTNDLLTLGRDWGANHVRWQLTWGGFPQSPADRGDLPAYDAWLEKALAHVDSLLPTCQQAGIKVLIDLHTPPGGRNQANECRLFHEARFQTHFLQWWEKIAQRYRDNSVVWGYDLVNEPVEGSVGDGLMDWQGLAAEAARRIRRIDAVHAIVVEPEPWGGPASLENLSPLPVSNVVYSVHMYEPTAFTHQGVYSASKPIAYPGPIGGKIWDKDQLRRVLQPVVEFQRANGAHIYMGEFSAIRWAPDDSAARYLRDVIDLCEEYGWDWAYHAFREWDGWSVEHGSDRNDRKPSNTATSREQLLRSWFKQNARP